MDTFLALVDTALKLMPTVGIAAPLVALLVDLLKRVMIGDRSLIPDGKAGLASLILNALVWVGLYAAGQLGIQVEAEAFLVKLGEFAPVVLALIVALWASPKFHEFAVARGFGFSHPDPKVGVSLPIRQSG